MTTVSKFVYVTVVAGARKEQLVPGDRPDTFSARVREPAARNQANARVRELIALYYQVPTATVQLVAGHHAARKRFAIST